jgi:hypothetical protein
MERTNPVSRETHPIGLPSIGIPAEVLFHPDLTTTEKILFGFIRNLAQSKRGCWASNRWLGGLIGVGGQTISNAVARLKQYHYIFVEYETVQNNGLTKNVRRIFINPKYPMLYRKMVEEGHEILEGGILENLYPHIRKFIPPYKKILSKDDIEEEKEVERFKDAKASTVPAERRDRNLTDGRVLSILNYWNDLPNTVKHKAAPTSNTYQNIEKMLLQLLQGYPIFEKAGHAPHQKLLNFTHKFGIDPNLLTKTWTEDEICSILQSITSENHGRYSLPELLFNQFAKGGEFSHFLFEADKQQVLPRFIKMADKLASAIGKPLSTSQQLSWAKEFEGLVKEGKKQAEIHTVLDWYMKNYDYQRVRSVSTAQEFCDHYNKIRKSMQIQQEERKPTLTRPTQLEDPYIRYKSESNRIDGVVNTNIQ